VDIVTNKTNVKITMNFDDYEQLPGSPPLWISLVAGASAGILEHISMYPVDTIKVRKSLF
jgi:solute carrier family 25 (mitochondrial iron transporter), member 28/37